MPISLAGTGIIISVLSQILTYFGFDIPVGDIEAGLNGLLLFIGLVLAIIGQVNRKDLKLGIIRK